MVLPSLSVCALARFLTGCSEHSSVILGGKRFISFLFSLESTTKCTNERIIISLKRKESFKGLIEEGKCLSGLKE